MSNDKAVYKYSEEFGRMGSLSGVFVAEKSAVASAMGKEVYFGEALGKHSEIIGRLGEDTIKMASDDPAVVKVVLELDLETGTNPFDYMEEEEEE
jgi:hypothetical protein